MLGISGNHPRYQGADRSGQTGTDCAGVGGFCVPASLDHFFELAGNLAVEVEFVVTADESARILDLVRESGARVVYARTPIEFGVINPAPDDTRE